MKTLLILLIGIGILCLVILIYIAARAIKKKILEKRKPEKYDLIHLRDSIEKLEKEGMKEEEITEKLEKAGWKKLPIELAIHEVHVPHNKLDKLQTYVDKQILKAKPKSQIKEELMDVGWTEEVIDLALGIEQD